jgi:hypothetical protein
LPGLLLPNDRSIERTSIGRDVLDPECDHITAAQLAIDGEIEHR